MASHNHLDVEKIERKEQHPLGIILAPHLTGFIVLYQKNILKNNNNKNTNKDVFLLRNHPGQLVLQTHPDAVRYEYIFSNSFITFGPLENGRPDKIYSATPLRMRSLFISHSPILRDNTDN